MNFEGYSFTLTIPPEKRVYYCGKRRKYGSLSNKQQWHFLCELMMKCIWQSHFSFIDYVFEQHNDGRLHIHGYGIPHKMYENFGVVERLVDNFYTLNQIVGIKRSVYVRLSKVEQTLVDKSYWLDYINKHQHEIIFRSHYEEELAHKKSLDNGVVIETRSISPPPEYYDKYRFTGEINKFFVEI